MRQRIKAEIEAVLKNLRDEYGLLDEDDSIPINLRKPTDSDDKTKTDPSPTKKSTDTANAADERKSVAQAPQKPTAGKSEEEIFNDDIKRARAEAEQTEDAEARKRTLEAVERRVQKRQEYLEKRAKDEKGANFFDIPPSLQLQERELRDGWCNLFDGKTLFGWRTQKEGPYGGGRFYVDNGELRSDPAHPGLVYTTNQFGDATLKFEYQTDEDAEVILLVRTSPNPWDLNSSAYSIVLNSADYTQPPGTILGRHTLSVDQLKKGGGRDAKSTTAVPIGKRWRRVSVLFEGTMLQVSIDKEEPVTLYEAKPLACGYVGLLVAKGNARFRNMFWSPGSTVSLFDGINPDLDWRNFKPDIVKWKPTREITLSMTGGPGVVESVKQFDNFVLQFEYNMTFTSGRSGLFFRSTPREESTGYEISIQNFPRQEDRLSTKGVDVGSFRGLKNARYVKPDDQKWNYFTLVVVDRQFQTWVNGIPVCEWSVPKDKDYIRSGTLQFLAPTDMTNVQFRNIRFAPIRQRGERAKTFEDRLQTTFAKEKESKIVADIEKRLDEEKKIEYEKTKTKK